MRRLLILGLFIGLASCGNDSTRPCTRVCTTGKACGDSCIAANLTCNQPAGTACDAR